MALNFSGRAIRFEPPPGAWDELFSSHGAAGKPAGRLLAHEVRLLLEHQD